MARIYIFLLITLCSVNIASAKTRQKKLDVIAYYTGNSDTLQKYPVEKITHIIYSFLHLRDDSIAFYNDKQPGILKQLTDLKQKYPQLKIMVSLGGWGGCDSCSPVFAKAESRKNFAASVAGLLEQYNVDGIDLDWEYPAIEGYPDHPYSKEDRDNFTALVKELRSAMGEKYELSFAAGGFSKYLEESVDWDAIIPLVTRVNLMTYDLINGYSTETGHHTALYSREKQKESTDYCVKYLLGRGVPAHKLAIGAAFYARVWENVSPVDHGLYQTGKFKTGVDYKHFDSAFHVDSGWVKYWDPKAKAPYAYNENSQLFATYDDERSLAKKVRYAQKYHLGGIMFWELMNDTYTDGRLDAIHNVLK